MFDDITSPIPPTPLSPRTADDSAPPLSRAAEAATLITQPPLEIGGPTGPEPTRYGDWERGGRCIDF